MGPHDERSEEWWAHQDSNLGLAGYEPAALTAELWAPMGGNSSQCLMPDAGCLTPNAGTARRLCHATRPVVSPGSVSVAGFVAESC